MRYIALTIEPIIDTLSLGRKTSEIWMASYIFSSFMKNSIKKIKKKEKDVKFIIPYIDDNLLERYRPKFCVNPNLSKIV